MPQEQLHLHDMPSRCQSGPLAPPPIAHLAKVIPLLTCSYLITTNDPFFSSSFAMLNNVHFYLQFLICSSIRYR